MFKKRVKCINCGFLGLLGGLEPWTEIETGQRGELLRRYNEPPLYVSCLRGQNNSIACVPPGNAVEMETLIKNCFMFRKCYYFFPHNPGHKPDQHLELLRDRNQRRFLVIVSLLSAVVGAVIATLANLIWS